MIFDYVWQIGDVPFSQEPINYLDLLVLTGIGYRDFPESCVGTTLGDALPQSHEPSIEVMDGDARTVATQARDDGELAAMVSTAVRYESVRVIDFESVYQEFVQQFAAVAFEVEGILVVVFRGTDATVTGWEEALRLANDVPVASQRDAARFLERLAEGAGGEPGGHAALPIVVCGHSKGGNLAEYAAVACAGASDDVAARMAAVVSFDGPGLRPRVRETEGFREIVGRMRTFIPKSSIVGYINGHPYGEVEIIDATHAFTAQHLIYNWKTEGTRFVPARRTIAGKLGSAALALLVDNLSDRGKNAIYRAIFAVPRALGKRTVT